MNRTRKARQKISNFQGADQISVILRKLKSL